jgi:hypothetical protein
MAPAVWLPRSGAPRHVCTACAVPRPRQPQSDRGARPAFRLHLPWCEQARLETEAKRQRSLGLGAGAGGAVAIDVAACGPVDGGGPGREFAGLREAWRRLVEAAWVRRDAGDGLVHLLQASHVTGAGRDWAGRALGAGPDG